ncbi:MAG TPA: MFS transporter [Candidatus Solibacter sp.]|jgi:MFS family permease|nr:MFS transporter [Candidatus Solibacter sp.]
MELRPENDVSYLSLFRVAGFGRLAATSLLGRGAQSMWVVAMVLFALQKFHSAGLAGLVVFFGAFPGLAASPVAGALIDRYGRVRFITFDYFVATSSLLMIAGLSATHLLTPALLLPLVTLGSVTGLLSAAGLRTMVPLLLPRHLWDRGNAADSVGYTAVAIAGPAIAGGLVGSVGAEMALLVTALTFAAGGVVMIGMPEPGSTSESSAPLLRDALAAIGYVVRNVTLRGLALSLFVLNIGAGILIVAIPVLILDHLHGGAAQVGWMWALQGVGGVVSALLFGRIDSEGHERHVIAGLTVVAGAAIAILLVATDIRVVYLASLVIGLSMGPVEVANFSLRQRATEVAWFGRAMAVSMSLNFSGNPIGSAITGPLLHFGLGFALTVSAGVTFVAAGVALVAIPRRPRAVIGGAPGA